MSLPIIPIIAIAALAMFAGGGKKRSKSITPSNGKPGGWLAAGDVCDPLDLSNVPPGYSCFAGQDGNFYVMEEYDPAKVAELNYGEFGDEQGVGEALLLLGFGQPDIHSNTARFQEYAQTYFDLADGSLRFDGQLDSKTIQYLSQAISDLENDTWTTEEDHLIQQAMLDFEYDNAVTFVNAWTQDPLIAWEFPDGEVTTPNKGGQLLSSWLTSAVYWGTYDVGGSAEPGASMPRVFWPIPFTDQWEAEAGYRAIWFRIESYVKLQMEELGIPDETIFPDPEIANA